MLPRRFVGSAIQKSYDFIKEVYARNKPTAAHSLHYDTLWRYESFEKTLDYVADPVKRHKLHIQAQLNLHQWAKESFSSPNLVEVVNKDWGSVTHEATKKYGKSYAVLNMANSSFPGGGVFEGLNAQEENMWHRSTCVSSLLDNHVIFDENAESFLYDEMTKKMLEAKLEMSDEEHAILEQRGAKTDSVAYKAFFDRTSRVCFRGPEISKRFSDFSFTESRMVISLDRLLSYSFLPAQEIFPFYELRSAAPMFDPKDPLLKEQLRQGIASQLDTLILEGQKHVVLGAWGCGVFKNDPELVAQIYREEIEKRADFFEHIIFAVLNSSGYDKHTIFERKLSQIRLGPDISNSSSTKP